MKIQLPISPSNIERFKSKLLPPDANGCRRCAGGKCEGYGRFWLDGETRPMHVVAYVIAYGEIPPGKDVLHTCGVKDCCTPEHLKVGIAKQTTLDNLGERFEAKVRRNCNEEGCDDFQRTRNAQGYGKIRFQGKHRTATHIAWFLAHSEWPILDGDKGIRHHCDNPWCVNPKHLYIGTAKQDGEDRVRRGRTAKGQRNGAYTHPESIKKCQDNANAKLSNEQAIVIRRTCDANPDVYGLHAALARMFGMEATIISDIAARCLWKTLPDDFAPDLKLIPLAELDLVARSGDDCPHKVLDSMKAGEIRFLYNQAHGRHRSLTRLAERYGMSISQVHRIVRGEQWPDAPEFSPHFKGLKPLFPD